MVIDGLGIKFAFYFSFPHWSVVSVTFPLPSCGFVEHFLDTMLMCLWVCLCRFGSGRSRDHTQCRDLSHDARLGLSGSAGVRTLVLALGSSPFPGEAGVTVLAQNSVSGGWDTQWAGPQMRVTRAPWGKGDTGWAAGCEACTVGRCSACPSWAGKRSVLPSRLTAHDSSLLSCLFPEALGSFDQVRCLCHGGLQHPVLPRSMWSAPPHGEKDILTLFLSLTRGQFWLTSSVRSHC